MNHLFAFPDDAVNHRTSQGFNGIQTIAHGISLCREFSLSHIDIRWEHGNTEFLTMQQILRGFCRIVNHGRHKCCHKFHRIVKLQPCGLYTDDRIGCRMGFVKRILCKIHHGIVNTVCRFLINAVCHAAPDAAL